nr:MAG TPA: metallophosphatase domain protein [Caudoviricetes sp.]
MSDKKYLSLDGLGYVCTKISKAISNIISDVDTNLTNLSDRFEDGVNLFNPYTITDVYYVDDKTGTLVTYPGWSYFTATLSEGRYIFSYYDTNKGARGLAPSLYYASYDEKGNFIANSGHVSTNTGIVDVPDGAKITKISAGTSILHGSNNYTKQMLSTYDYYKSNGKYVEYIGNTVLKDEYIPVSIVRKKDMLSDTAELLGRNKALYDEELEKTANTVLSLTDSPCVVFALATDTHYASTDAFNVERTSDTFRNIKALSKKVTLDGIIHLGDVLIYGDGNADGDTQDRVDRDNQYVVNLMHECTDNVYITQGNHDGIHGQNPRTQNYCTYGRVNNGKVIRNGDKPYFYFDIPSVRLRMIFIVTSECENGYDVWGMSSSQLVWFTETLKSTPNTYNIMLFSHIGIFDTIDYRSNRTETCNLVNSYNSHSGDYSTKTGRVIAWFAGHEHLDCIIKPSDSDISCTQIVTQCSLFGSWTPTEDYAYIYNRNWIVNPREDGTVTQECWDVMIYRPDEQKIHMVRFGSGEDREIDVSK